jgi:hypothetical protein
MPLLPDRSICNARVNQGRRPLNNVNVCVRAYLVWAPESAGPYRRQVRSGVVVGNKMM